MASQRSYIFTIYYSINQNTQSIVENIQIDIVQ